MEANFFERVYAIARQIPYGKVTSYGAIAAYLGTKMSARMVGWAMNGAHLMKDIPAHRLSHSDHVVNLIRRTAERNFQFRGSPDRPSDVLCGSLVALSAAVAGIK